MLTLQGRTMEEHDVGIRFTPGEWYFFGSTRCGRLDMEADVAVPLSRLCPFLGRTRRPWSFASHAVCCSALAERRGASPEVQWFALHVVDHVAVTGVLPVEIQGWLTFVGDEGLVDVAWRAQRAIERAVSLRPPTSRERDLASIAHLAVLQGSRSVLAAVEHGGQELAEPTLVAAEIVEEHVGLGMDESAARSYLARHHVLASVLGW